MDFHVGQKVVFVDDTPIGSKVWLPGAAPTLGQVYTVAKATFLPSFHPTRDLKYGPIMYLAEIQNARPDGVDVGYRAFRFRPVKTTNIDVFLKMLAPQPVKELAHG